MLGRFGLQATVRPSLALDNTCSEVDEMVAVLHRLTNSGPRSPA
jgi:cysteine desulfurase / selenocysteine lyase